MALNVDNPKGETFDPYDSKARFIEGKDEQLNSIQIESRAVISQYINDMSKGNNVSSKIANKKKRGYNHLNTLLSRLKKICEYIEKETHKRDITTVTAEEMKEIFNKMEDGTYKYKSGKTLKTYRSTHDYVKIFKAFWHWYMKVKGKQGIDIRDITEDLSSTSEDKPDFIYITYNDFQKLLSEAPKFDYKVMMALWYDTGIRPTEFLNLRRKDIIFEKQENKEVIKIDIRAETSKTLGRILTLALSHDLMKQYLNKYDFEPNEFLFKEKLVIINQYLSRLFDNVFGKHLKGFEGRKNSKKHLTIYDFRHSSACYWEKQNAGERFIKYRFGWSRDKMINYYTEFLGIKDEMPDNALLHGLNENVVEKENKTLLNQINILQETLQAERKETEKRLKEQEKQFNILKKRVYTSEERHKKSDAELMRERIKARKWRDVREVIRAFDYLKVIEDPGIRKSIKSKDYYIKKMLKWRKTDKDNVGVYIRKNIPECSHFKTEEEEYAEYENSRDYAEEYEYYEKQQEMEEEINRYVK